MADGLRGLGVGIEDLGQDRLHVNPPAGGFTPAAIDCGLAGTVLRFLPPVAALAPGRSRFTGDARASSRPLRPLLDGLSQLGVRIDSPGGSVPFTMEPPPRLGGPAVSIDASASSQFVSGLLLTGARYPLGIDLRHVGPPVPSGPHIEMTVAMVRAHGVVIDQPGPDRWIVHPGPVRGFDETVEPDLTNAAAFLAAGVLSRGWVEVPGWPRATSQPGEAIRGILAVFGATAERAPGEDGPALRATWRGGLAGATLDLHDCSELTPVVSALAAFAQGDSVISGVAHIRGHETDRIAAIVETLAAVGIAADPRADGLVVHGVGEARQGLRAARLGTYGDHRMAHLAALLGLVVPGVRLDDVGVTAKTMPDFPQRWARMTEQAGA